MKPINWDIRRKGRLWSHEEFDERISQAPEKIEFANRHAFWGNGRRYPPSDADTSKSCSQLSW